VDKPATPDVLIARMEAVPLDIERIHPDSAEFRYLI
jgi:hypothetical protein